MDSAVPVAASSIKPTEPKKGPNMTFSSAKMKPKLFVGAAFFSTSKRPTSMYKKPTPRSKPAPAQTKAEAPPKATVAPPKAEAKRPQQQAVAPDQTPSPKCPQQNVAEVVREGLLVAPNE